MFGIMNLDTFGIYQVLSLSLSTRFKEGGDIYDKERISSIYYNIASILSCHSSASKIEKTSDFTTM